MLSETKISIIGLGYVGLPLAIHLSRHFHVIGFDHAAPRIRELREGYDRTKEIDSATLRSSTLHLSDTADDLGACHLHIVTVPTPIDSNNQPDLGPLMSATQTLAPHVKSGDIIVYESTVYPGVTEDICGPLLAEVSGLRCGQDFFLGYSPERINPGDKIHTVDKITKIVSGQTPEVTEKLRAVYGAINQDNIFVAANIKTAEAAKAIENAQRDINIAFVNEIATIFDRIGLSTHDVLDAAGTKWNFLNFKPGLVGGHCIGVDPYYLAYCAEQNGLKPDVILSGRRTNEQMAEKTAQAIEKARIRHTNTPQNASTGKETGENRPRTLVLGLTFKENVPDLRNSKVPDLIHHLRRCGHRVDVHDPIACPIEAKSLYGLDLLSSLDLTHKGYNCIVAAVSHRSYENLGPSALCKLAHHKALFYDLKGFWRGQTFPPEYGYCCL